MTAPRPVSDQALSPPPVGRAAADEGDRIAAAAAGRSGRVSTPRLGSEGSGAEGSGTGPVRYGGSDLPIGGGTAGRHPRAFVAAMAGVALVAAGVLLAIYLFSVALQLLSASAGGTADALSELSVDGPLNLLGFGWLMTYGTLAGSPVAALSLSLLDGAAIEPREALAMLAGSRFGASLIVLAVGFVAYLRGHRLPDGIYIGVIALLTTAAIYAPATVLALVMLDAGWFDQTGSVVPSGWGAGVERVTGPLVDPLVDGLPAFLLFVSGVGLLLLAFWIFDRLLPNLDPPSERVERLSRRLSSVRAMFLLGLLLTAVTMSVAISVTILVPLTLKGIVRRHSVIPYIMGANISTFVDTLFASVLLPVDAAVGVVLAQVVAVTIVSLLVLVFAYGPFSRVILALAHRASSSRSGLATFLAICALLPVALLVV